MQGELLYRAHVHFSHAVLGKRPGEDNLLGNLVLLQAASRVLSDVIGSHLTALLPHNDGADLLAKVFVRNTDHLTGEYTRNPQDDVFHLRWTDVFSAADDQLLDPPFQVQIPV